MPWTPLSYAGVARRTAQRADWYSATHPCYPPPPPYYRPPYYPPPPPYYRPPYPYPLLEVGRRRAATGGQPRMNTTLPRRPLLGGLAALAAPAPRPRPRRAPSPSSCPSRRAAAPTSLTRLLAERMTQMLGRAVQVENRPGGNTIVGAESVARAQPDGHTLLMAAGTTLTINPSSCRTCPTGSRISRRSCWLRPSPSASWRSPRRPGEHRRPGSPRRRRGPGG